MASTYTLNNGIELIGTGEQSGTWGDTTNTNFELVDTALDGQVSVTLASAGSSGSPNNLPVSDGATSNGRNRMVTFVDGGDLGATAYVQLTPNDSEKIIYVRNDLSGSRSVIMFQGTYNASNDYEIPAGTTAIIYFDGAGSGAVAANVFNNAYFDSLRLGGVSVTAIIDDDSMGTASATNIATSESIKAYVDAQVGTADELSEVLANGNTTGGNNILFADNDKAVFGAGSDLQIYHNGTHSYIQDTGAGNLRIDGADIQLRDISTGNLYFLGQQSSGEARLYHSGSKKLATTSTGIDVTGGVTADGLTVDGTGVEVASINSTQNGSQINFNSASSPVDWSVGISNSADGDFLIYQSGSGSGDINLYTGGLKRQEINRNGDISFYEDTGTTAKMVWKASDERLGIGTAAPSGLLHISSSAPAFYMTDTTNNTDSVISMDNAGSLILNADLNDEAASSNIRFAVDGSEAMRIEASGNVGIGVSPETATSTYKALELGYSTAILARTSANQSYFANNVYHDSSWKYKTTDPAALYQQVDDQHVFFNAASGTADTTASFSEAMRIDASGNVGIGTPSQSVPLHVFAGANNTDVAIFTGAQLSKGLKISTFGSGGSNDGGANLNVFNALTASINGTEAFRLDSAGVDITGANTTLKISNTTEDDASLILVDSASDSQNLTLAYDCQLEIGRIDVDNITHVAFRGDGNTYFGAGGGATSAPYYDAGNNTQIFPQIALNSIAAGTKNDGTMALFSWGTGGNVEPQLVLGHSTSGVIGNNATALVGGNNLGRILFNGSDGTKMASGVFMFAEASGTWTSTTSPSNFFIAVEKDDGSYANSVYSHDGYWGISDATRWATGGNIPDGLMHLYSHSPKLIIDNSAETEGGILFRDGNAGDPDAQSAAIMFDSGSTISTNALSFYNNDYSAGESALAMRIYPDQNVSRPQQSAFHARTTTNESPAVNGDITFNNVLLNNGSNYSTSNGRFTAPVPGIYTFTTNLAFINSDTADDSMTLNFQKNGVTYAAYPDNPSAILRTGVEITLSATCIISLAAGDYVTVSLLGVSSARTTDLYNNSHFMGHLI